LPIKFYRNKIYAISLLLFVLMVVTIIPISAISTKEFLSSLTEDELFYIQQNPKLKAHTGSGAAPLIYVDDAAQVQGIFKQVLHLIEEKTTLKFELVTTNSVDEIISSDSDIFVAISPSYNPIDLTLTQPFFRTETILFANKNVDLNFLDDKIFAAVEGASLPSQVNASKVKYFTSREETLNGVEKGKADYGFGNIYSIAYYVARNGYKNIVTVPTEVEVRLYSFALLKENPLLLSILNKAIDTIDFNTIQQIVLEEAGRLERKITIGLIIEAYSSLIILVATIVVLLLVLLVYLIAKANKKNKIQKNRYEILSQISNEYLYEYDRNDDKIVLSDECESLFETEEQKERAKALIKEALKRVEKDFSNFLIQFPIANDTIGTFKAINLKFDKNKKGYNSIIGKLVDVSEDIAEKRELINRSQMDGLSGVLNSMTAKNFIDERLKKKKTRDKDVFILLDFDDFKIINDTYGHLAGDSVLSHLGSSLRRVFDSGNEIMGRIGGDEFCVYIPNFESLQKVKEQCDSLGKELGSHFDNIPITLSFGITEIEDKESFEEIFKRADVALYDAKQNGKAQIVVYKKIQELDIRSAVKS